MAKPAKPVAVYLRVSTDDQDHASQVGAVDAWLASKGVSPAKVEWYRETETGTRMNRKEMTRLETDVRAGKVNTIVCYKLDRISRGMLDGMNFMARMLDSGCRVVSVTEQIDATGIMGRMMAAMLFGFAEMEHAYRAERQAAGIAAARERGGYLGRKPGTTKGEPSRAAELRARGLTPAEIASALGVSAKTVRRYLRSGQVAKADADAACVHLD